MTQENTWPPEFTLDKKKILELLTGDRFYSNASATLREVVLNALDAVHRRKVDEPHHEGSIRVIFDSSQLTLTCEDNGDGMDRETVVDLFTTVGASASELSGRGRDAIGEFGIGVVSYFMAADEFEIETCDGEHNSIGLKFRKDMFAGGHAEEFKSNLIDRGTVVRLSIRDNDTYEILKDSYPHWCRRVNGLTAIEQPENIVIPQAEDHAPSPSTVELPIPDGIENAFLRPLSTVDAWESMSGSSTITILYRGVFVQDYIAKKLWGMTGSVFVDPKHFKPRLNREGFVGEEFQEEIDAFLKSAHPVVLDSLVELLSRSLSEGTLREWETKKWATLWLSIPRENEYLRTAAKWDSVFRRIPAFELSRGDSWISASVDDLVGLEGPIYVAPNKRAGEADQVRNAALRLLRQMGKHVIRGLERDRHWLEGASNYFATTADLISRQFEKELPAFSYVANEAERILETIRESHVLFGGERPVEMVRLGDGGPPVLQLKSRLLINTDVEIGRSIIFQTLALNRGRKGLVDAAIDLSPESLQQVANFARAESSEDQDVLGLVKRRYIRELLS